jgi:hypothetical protein
MDYHIGKRYGYNLASCDDSSYEAKILSENQNELCPCGNASLKVELSMGGAKTLENLCAECLTKKLEEPAWMLLAERLKTRRLERVTV